jgi:hypothetical protein
LSLTPSQVSGTSQTPADGRQTAVLFASLGQLGPLPVQLSATSQTPAAARQTVELGAKRSVGQVVLEPVQFSATSQAPADGRQTVELGASASAGQAAADPLQCSAGSQSPADARQTVLLDSKTSVGQAPLEPVQCSATSQTPAEGRQTVLLGSKPSLGQVTAVPSQCSATSQSPPVGRHTVVAGATPSLGQGCPAEPVQFSATSHGPAAGRHVTNAPLTLSVGQGWPATPVQVSSGSQRSPEPVRQTVPLAVITSAGQLGVVPSQCSVGSHESPEPGRQTAPACPAGWAHAPVPLHWSVVQVSPSSVHAVPARSKQLFAPSLHVLAHSGPPVQGSPACTVHDPPLQVSAPSQKRPSLQADPLGSGAVQLLAASLQDSLQLPSPSGPGHGSPVCAEQLPPLQVSLPLQKRPSVQAEPLGSGAVQLSAASLQDSLQLPSPSGPGHGSPVCAEQVPPLQVSAPSQKRPSLQAEPLGSGGRCQGAQAVRRWRLCHVHREEIVMIRHDRSAAVGADRQAGRRSDEDGQRDDACER